MGKHTQSPVSRSSADRRTPTSKKPKGSEREGSHPSAAAKGSRPAAAAKGSRPAAAAKGSSHTSATAAAPIPGRSKQASDIAQSGVGEFSPVPDVNVREACAAPAQALQARIETTHKVQLYLVRKHVFLDTLLTLEFTSEQQTLVDIFEANYLGFVDASKTFDSIPLPAGLASGTPECKNIKILFSALQTKWGDRRKHMYDAIVLDLRRVHSEPSTDPTVQLLKTLFPLRPDPQGTLSLLQIPTLAQVKDLVDDEEKKLQGAAQSVSGGAGPMPSQYISVKKLYEILTVYALLARPECKAALEGAQELAFGHFQCQTPVPAADPERGDTPVFEHTLNLIKCKAARRLVGSV